MCDRGNPSQAISQEIPDETVAAIGERWELVLGTPAPGPETPFFEAGGDSAKAVELALLVDEAYPGCVDVVDLFDHPTISSLARLVTARRKGEGGAARPARRLFAAPTRGPAATVAAAVVGIACRFPGVGDEKAFWRLLHDGGSVIGEVPERRWERPGDPQPEVPWVGGFFPDVEGFEAGAFGLARRDAARTDPQQLLLLAAARELLEQVGPVERLAGSRTGVFVGATQSGFGETPSPEAWLNGQLTSLLANRVSYHYDLHGPSEVLDTACSSSLVAVHRALGALATGECDLAIAGGISLMVTPSRYLMMGRNGMLSPSGACRPFDERADGVVPGEGVALLALARLGDARAEGRAVRAVIRGSATGSDGRTNGINAPRAETQVEVLTEAWRRAGVDPSALSYVEAHGTATPLGDPIEMRALATALAGTEGGAQRRPCMVGSVKGNLGHLEWAAGAAGLVKVILALERGEVPPTVGLERANPRIELGASLAIPTRPTPWVGDAPRRAGVSSFGAGGTNCHVVVEEATTPVRAGGAAAGEDPVEGPADLLYAPAWRRAEPEPGVPEPGLVLLAGGAPRLREATADALRAAGFEVALAPAAADGADLQQGLADPPRVPTVVWLGACLAGGTWERGAAAAAERATTATVELSRLLSAFQRRGGLHRVLAVTRRAQTLSGDDPGDPALAAVSGVLAAAAAEFGGLRTAWLDVDADRPAGVARAVARELLAGAEGAIADRGGRRFVQEWSPCEAGGSELASALPERATYLITGGLGGIGLALARDLARRARGRLVLIGRSPPAPRELAEIESLGSAVLALRADVGDRAALAGALAAARARFGRIDVAIHAAGVLEDGLLANVSRERCAATIAPKVAGAWALREALAAEPPGVVALFSSAMTVFGNAGQASYLAANACLDALAADWSRGGQRVLAIDWSAWAGVGMAARSGHDARSARQGLPPLPTPVALAAFDAAIGSGRERVLIARLSPERREQLLEGGRARGAEVEAPPPGEGAPRRRHGEIAELIGGVLASGLEEPPGSIAADASFFDLGASSLDLVALVERLSEELGREVPPTACYEHPTVASLAAHLAAHGSEAPVPAGGSLAPGDDGDRQGDVALVALACRFPGAVSPEDFWELLRQGGDAVAEIPPSRWGAGGPSDADPAAHAGSRWAGLLDDVAGFDPLLFRLSPREASRVDPHQRLALEVAWEALERGGYGADSPARRRTGVFFGAEPSEYAALGEVTVDSATGGANSGCLAANRVSYFFNLTGPSLVVDTACSSSAMAIHLACRSLAAGDCEMALAGGVKVLVGRRGFAVNSAARMLSPSGRCRAFDDGADGYVRAEGAGAVLLKPLADARRDGDRVLAVIKSTSACHDGGAKAGLTAPSPDAQKELLLDAWERAGVEPRTISYVEAHGTGTALGDPLEVEALSAAFREHTPDVGFCTVGSVKANIGHAEAAAGLAALAKVVLALEHGELPPTPHLRRPNHRVDWDSSPVLPARTLRSWEAPDAAPRRAGVSAFGFGGAGVHIVVEEAPATDPIATRDPRPRLYALSARTPAALRQRAHQLRDRLGEDPELRLEDVAATLAQGRTHLAERAAMVAANRGELRDGLDAIARGERPAASGEAGLEEIARRYVDGEEVEWERAGCDGRRQAPLPTYPFERERYWIDDKLEAGPVEAPPPSPPPDGGAHAPWLLEPIWRRVGDRAGAVAGSAGSWLLAGGREPLVACLRDLIESGGGSVRRGADLALAGLDGSVRGKPEVAGAVVFAEEIGPERLPGALHAIGELAEHLARAPRPGGPPRLVLVVRGADRVLDGDRVEPAAAALAAGVRALAHERPEVGIAAIDVGDAADEEAAAWVAAAISAGETGDGAVRDGGLWSRGLSAASARESTAPAPLAQGGLYVVAGGTGGIGGVIAGMLASEGAGRVLLLSRGAAPGAALSEQMLARSADLADPDAVRRALEEARASHGPIRGVVHAAGAIDHVHRSLRTKTTASIAAVLAPKVAGTEALHELTADDPLEFFVLCTSISALFGALGAGQVDYAAANGFQDAFAAARGGPGRSLAVAWPRWRDVGMAAGRPVSELEARLGIDPLSSRQGVELLRAALRDHDGRTLAVLPHDRPAEVAAELLAPPPPPAEPAPAAGSPDRAQPLEQWLRATVARYLELPAAELDPRADLDSYGIDSLNVVEILGALEERFDAVLEPSVVLEHGSVGALASYLHERFGSAELAGGARVELA